MWKVSAGIKDRHVNLYGNGKEIKVTLKFCSVWFCPRLFYLEESHLIL